MPTDLPRQRPLISATGSRNEIRSYPFIRYDVMDARLHVVCGIEAELGGYDVTDVGPVVNGRHLVEEFRVVEVDKFDPLAGDISLEGLRRHKELDTGSALGREQQHRHTQGLSISPTDDNVNKESMILKLYFF